MPGQQHRFRYLDAVVVVFLIAALLFLSPVLYLWTSPGAAWYVPYLLWLLVILLGIWAGRLRSRHEL